MFGMSENSIVKELRAIDAKLSSDARVEETFKVALTLANRWGPHQTVSSNY